MSKRDKLARGGVYIHPLLANGKRPEVFIFFSMRTQRLYKEAFKELTGRETNFTEAIRTAAKMATKNHMIDLPDEELIAIIRAASMGQTNEELSLEDIDNSIIDQVDRTRIYAALIASLPAIREGLKPKDWKALNEAKDPEAVIKDFFTTTLRENLKALGSALMKSGD
ncbi:MAG: hypothetical protein V3U84_03985 [Thiotrichaceae bacterium]